ncbi:MAG: glycosyltransferase, partial [Terriglobus roseus]|nr:glycosyltransferase [Terriglobus roseus]
LAEERRVALDARGEDLAEAYASADIFVFASLTETFGNVLLEAAASGLPIVACDALGVRDLVLHGRTGLLGPPADPDAMRQNILRVANDPKLMERMGVEARAFAEKYTTKFSFDIINQSYNTVRDLSLAPVPPHVLTRTRRSWPRSRSRARPPSCRALGTSCA